MEPAPDNLDYNNSLPHPVFVAAAGASRSAAGAASGSSTSAGGGLPFAGRLFPVADLERFAERLGTSVDEAKALLACQGVGLLGDGDSAEERGGGRRSP